MTANLPDRPGYFSYDVDLNLQGVKPLEQVPVPKPITEKALAQAAKKGAVIIDTRSPEEFGEGHFPGSINIGVGSPSFSTWSGFMVAGGKPIALVVRSEKDAKKARLELARIGFDNLIGYLTAEALTEKQFLAQMSIEKLKAMMEKDGLVILDVRTPSEWQSNHIDGATHVPLSSFAKQIPNLPKSRRIAVICGSGYRSSIAGSLLQAQGYEAVENVHGGMEAY